MENNTRIDTQIQLEAQVDLSTTANSIADNFLGLFTDPWYIVALVCTFMLGMLTSFVCKAFFSKKMPKKTQALYIWGSQLLGGYGLTLFFVVSPFVNKFAVFSGVMTIALYYILLGVANKFKLNWLTNFLKIKSVIRRADGTIDFEATLKSNEPLKTDKSEERDLSLADKSEEIDNDTKVNIDINAKFSDRDHK